MPTPQRTSGYSGADLVALVREAALDALKEDADAAAVAQRHFEVCVLMSWCMRHVTKL